MKKYLLLRNNRESGPHSIEELRGLNPQEKDLVWLEGESNCWLYPSEIEELKDFVTREIKRQSRIFVSKPRVAFQDSGYSLMKESTPFRREDTVEKETGEIPDSPKKNIWKSKKLSTLANIFSVSALSCGLILGAVVMKKAVDNSDATIAAEEVPLSVIRDTDTPPAAPVQNALLMETIPAKQIVAKPGKPVKPKNIRDQVSIKASEYSVGVLGGISNLQLRLFNNSNHRLEKVTLAIEYLKPNGSVIETDQYDMYSIKPLSGSTLSIPNSKRGVKIKYRIVEISSKETREI